MSENKKKFNLFDWYFKGGKDTDKLDVNILEKPNLKNFFIVLWKKLGKLLSANLLFIFGNFPIFFILISLSGIFSESASAPLYQAWGPIYGAMKFGNTSTTSILSAIFGVHAEVNVINLATKIFFALGAIIIFTLGFTKVGTTYLYRNIMSGEGVFPFSDFVYIIKKNVKQSLIIGIIDVVFIGAFSFNIYFLWQNYNVSTMNGVMLFFTITICIIYSFVRNYAYIMIFTFDLKIKQIIKNSLFLSILGIKRNLCAFLGVAGVVLLNYTLFIVFMPIGALLPFIITFAVCDFIGVYTAYPVILKYMVSDEDRKRLIYKLDDYEETEIDD